MKRKSPYPKKGAGAKRRRVYTGAAIGPAMARDMARGRLIAYARPAGELKGVDGYIALDPIIDTTSTNASCTVVNLIDPGTASFNRIGRKIRMKSLRLKMIFLHVSAPAATTSNVINNVVRMVVVYDKQPSGAIPTFDDIFGCSDRAGTETGGFYSNLRYDNTDRFKVLKDRYIPMNATLATTAGSTNQARFVHTCEEYIDLKGLETVYSGQSSPCTIADVSSGALYVFYRANLNTTTTNFTLIDGDSNFRLRYMD